MWRGNASRRVALPSRPGKHEPRDFDVARLAPHLLCERHQQRRLARDMIEDGG